MSSSSSSSWFNSSLNASSTWIEQMKRRKKTSTTSSTKLSLTKGKVVTIKPEKLQSIPEITIFSKPSSDSLHNNQQQTPASFLAQKSLFDNRSCTTTEVECSNNHEADFCSILSTPSEQSSSKIVLVKSSSNSSQKLTPNNKASSFHQISVSRSGLYSISAKSLLSSSSDFRFVSSTDSASATNADELVDSTSTTLQLLSSIQTALEWVSGGAGEAEMSDDAAENNNNANTLNYSSSFKQSFMTEVLVKETHRVLCRLLMTDEIMKDNKETLWTSLDEVIPVLQNELKSKFALPFLDLNSNEESDTILLHDLVVEAIRNHQHSYSIGQNRLLVSKTPTSNQNQHPLLAISKRSGVWCLRPVFYAASSSESAISQLSSIPLPPSPALLAARLLHLLGGDTGVVRAVGILQRVALLESRSDCLMTNFGRRVLASSFEYVFRCVASAIKSIQGAFPFDESFFCKIVEIIMNDARELTAAKDSALASPFDDPNKITGDSNQAMKSKEKKSSTSSKIKRIKVGDSESDDDNKEEDKKDPLDAIKSIVIHHTPSSVMSQNKNIKNKVAIPLVIQSAAEDSAASANSLSIIKFSSSEEFRSVLDTNKTPLLCPYCGLFSCSAPSTSSSSSTSICPLPGLKLWILPSGLVDPEEVERKRRQAQIQKEREEKEIREAQQRLEAQEQRRKLKEEKEAEAKKMIEEELESRRKQEEQEKFKRRERECSPAEILYFLHRLNKSLKAKKSNEISDQTVSSWWWYDSVVLIIETLSSCGEGLSLFTQLPRKTADIVEAMNYTIERATKFENDEEFRKTVLKDEEENYSAGEFLKIDSPIVSFLMEQLNILMQKEVALIVDGVLNGLWKDRDRQMKGMNLIAITGNFYVE